MARPEKVGLEYFALDVDMDQDDKITLVEAKYGIEGFGIIIKLLMKIYKEGYFYEWNEKQQLLFSKRVNVNINLVNDIINDSLCWQLFHKDLYDSYKILTSKGIQTRYFSAIVRRKSVEIIHEYYLLNGKDTPTNIVFVNINSINVCNNSVIVNNKYIKESKGKESIVDYSSTKTIENSEKEPSEQEEQHNIPAAKLFYNLSFDAIRGHFAGDITNTDGKDFQYLKEQFQISEENLIKELMSMEVWLVANPDKQKKNYKRFIYNWLNRR